ncbi:MAG: beta galactosidase jelly roll domain-containing protein [Phycisphaeraceae bacterium]|nr:MAG: beta galactosidase jelly roll domain-containing protein [Phycisphaeraceae bacterium]
MTNQISASGTGRAALRAFVALVLSALCGLSALFGVSGANAQDVDLLINVDNRETVSLDGDWRTIVDPYEVGYYDYRWHPSQWGFFRDDTQRDKSQLIEYSFDRSPQLKVPGDWNTQRDDLYYYEGTVWYRKKFDFTKRSDERVFLYFGAANYDARVYLNGEQLGRHIGGFTPFDFEVTDKLQDGENSVVVKVDNKRYQDAVPTINTDWWNYGGLTRRVMLVRTPRTYVRDYMIQLDPRDPGKIKGWVQVAGDEPSRLVTVSIPDTGISTTVKTDDEGRANVVVDAPGLELWTPEHPRLYDVLIETAGHALIDQIGFRTITTKGHQILLNGEPVFLRGVCIHEEAPLRTGRACTVEDARTSLGWAKDMNGNFVRLAHYCHQEQMLREADREGILVWAEVPVYWTISWDNKDTYENARRQLGEMVTRDRNRACVILWSVANETPNSDARMKFLTGLIDTCRTLDPTRLVTAALEKSYQGDSTVVINDPLGDHLDVIGCNEYIGWYDGMPDKPARVRWQSTLDKPVIFSEFGGGALYGLHADDRTRWTEEFQADIYRNQVEMFREIDFLAGTCPWILMDFRSPRRTLPDIQDGWNRKGLISERGEKKEAFGIMRAFYGEKLREQE